MNRIGQERFAESGIKPTRRGVDNPTPESVHPMTWEEAERIDKAPPRSTTTQEWWRMIVRKAIALARQEKERAERRLALADKLAEAVGRLPITAGPVVDALRAYREGVE